MSETPREDLLFLARKLEDFWLDAVQAVYDERYRKLEGICLEIITDANAMRDLIKVLKS